MSKDQPIYVIDTNILVDYVDVIPWEGGKQPLEPTIDLSHAHIVIPTVVVRELSNFKGEKNSDRGKAARVILKRLRKLFEGDIHSMDEVYGLRAPITVENVQPVNVEEESKDTEEESEEVQRISILPVHKDFWKCLPFHPSDRDMDGQIILTALAASLAKQGKPNNGSELNGTICHTMFDNVVLLTNDNGLAIRARERGLMTARYGYKYPAPYTGRREVTVPNELFAEFYNSPERQLSRALFEQAMPDEPPLVANEFIVMHLEDPYHPPSDYKPYEDKFFDNVGRYDADKKAIVKLCYTRSFPVPVRNVGQAIYAEALMDPNITAIVCTGPAGSGKTFMATIFGYEACLAGNFIGVTTVPCENRSNIGALPGDLDEKMDPDVQPLKNALRNYILHTDPDFKKMLKNQQQHAPESDLSGNNSSKNGKSNGNGSKNGTSIKTRLRDKVNNIWDNIFSSVPIENARGRDFSHEIVIYDEFQDQSVMQADTLLKRIGVDAKVIITGDIDQIHAPYLDRDTNGLVYASRSLHDNEMVAQVCFTEEEVVRSQLVKEITHRQRAAKTRPDE